MQQFDGVKAEHRRLLALADQLAQLLSCSSPPPAQTLYPLRQQFASALSCHLKLEDWLVYPRLVRCSNELIAQTAVSFREEMGGLAASFAAHSGRWNAISINADWAGYREEMVELLAALVARISREDDELYPLCASLNATAIKLAS